MRSLPAALGFAIRLGLAAPAGALANGSGSASGSASVSPGECRVIDGGDLSLGHIDAATRIRFLQHSFRHAARRARVWSWTWAGAFTALTVGQLALSPAYPADARVDLYVGAASSLVGVLSLVVLPMRVMGDQRRFDARLAEAPADADLCALLADGERRLLRDAASERDGQSGLLHAGNMLLNIAAGLVLGIGFHRWSSALLNIFGGSAVGEVMLLTQPTEAVKLLSRYRRGDLSSRPAPEPVWSLAPDLGPNQIGLRFTVNY